MSAMHAASPSRALVEGFCSLRSAAPPVAFGFLRQHGQQMPLSPLNARYKQRGKLGQCYVNSARASLYSGLWYCEGYAVPGNCGIPLAHAWLCDEQGRAIDPTWRDGTDYFGVPFTEQFRDEFNLRTGYHGILCNLFLVRSMPPHQLLEYLSSGIASLESVTA